MAIDPSDAQPVAWAPLAAAPEASPRVWTLVVAFALALLGAGLGTALSWAALSLATASRAHGRITAPTFALFETVAASPAGMLASGLAACLSFALCALVPAALSSEFFDARLRLAPRPHWIRWGVVTGLGMVGVGMASSGVIALAGLEGRGSLGVVHRALYHPSPGLALAAFATVCLGAGTGEELFFRGYVQTRLAQRWGATWSVVVSAVLFALVHFDPIHSAFAFLAGALLGWASLRVGTIRATIVAHVLNNTVSLAGMALTDPTSHTSRAEAFGELAAGLALTVIAAVALRRAPPHEG